MKVSGSLKHGFDAARGGGPETARPKKKPLPPVSVRLTEEERLLLEKAAGKKSLSAHIRECLFRDQAEPRRTRRKPRIPVKDHQALARLLALLGASRIPNNLNQLARDANCDSLEWNKETTAKINEAYEHVLFMRRELIRALGLSEDQS